MLVCSFPIHFTDGKMALGTDFCPGHKSRGLKTVLFGREFGFYHECCPPLKRPIIGGMLVLGHDALDLKPAGLTSTLIILCL